MKIINEDFNSISFSDNDMFILVISYENRSLHLLNACIDYMHRENTVIFFISGFEKNKTMQNKINELNLEERFDIKKLAYNDAEQFQNHIVNYILKSNMNREHINIHIDYSSMPRSWYCSLPLLLFEQFKHKSKLFFWYSEGVYSINAAYPSSSLKGFQHFSGYPSLPIDRKRIHILSLGLDSIRTQAIISIVDPEMLVLCYAFEPQNIELKNGIEKVNQHALSLAALRFSLPIDDMEFMRSKLTEIVVELNELGDVIMIPDGPKPLIMAMSLVSQLLRIDGFTCLQIERNIEDCEPVFVEAGNNFFGFSIRE